jgi:hypothetical protein
MDKETIRQVMAEMGRKGGKARLKTMSPEERRERALKAAEAAAKVHKQKARERKAKKKKT